MFRDVGLGAWPVPLVASGDEFHRIPDSLLHLVQLKGLNDIINSIASHGFKSVVRIPVGRDKDEWSFWSQLRESVHKLKATQLGHANIRNNEIDFVLMEVIDGG